MPAPQMPKEEIVDRLATVFREFGYDGASLKLLSDATGLGRSSLYHYFPNGKEDMAAAVLAKADDWGLERLRPIIDGTLPPEEKARRLATELSAFYQDGERACLLELFTIGNARDLFAEKVGQRMIGMGKIFQRIAEEAGVEADDAQVKAEEALIALHGALVVSRATGTNALFKRVLASLPDLLTP